MKRPWLAGALALAAFAVAFVLYKRAHATPASPPAPLPRPAPAPTPAPAQGPANPWRGTGSKCEQAFDKLSVSDRTDLVAFLRTASSSDPNAARTVATFLGLPSLDCMLPAYV
jgi:hypothetical protein